MRIATMSAVLGPAPPIICPPPRIALPGKGLRPRECQPEASAQATAPAGSRLGRISSKAGSTVGSISTHVTHLQNAQHLLNALIGSGRRFGQINILNHAGMRTAKAFDEIRIILVIRQRCGGALDLFRCGYHFLRGCKA